MPGLRLLDFSAWIRQQAWLRFFYRHLPQRWRDKGTQLLAEPARRSLRFPRTPAWNAPPPASVRIDASKAPAAGVPGVNVLGYVRGQFGLGESVRAHARALIEAGIPVSLYDVDIGLAYVWNDHSLEAWISDELPYQTSLVFFNPDYWPQAMEKIGRARLQGHYVIACWFWELERIPEAWIPILDQVDELVVATEFIEQAFRKATDKPITRIAFPLREVACSDLQRRDFGLPEGKFVFLTSFDFNSYIARKNPRAVIEAFKKAFPPDREDVRLLVKSSGGFLQPAQLEPLLEAVGGDARIMLRDDVIERSHVNALQRCCDAYVSLHRAEGLGLGLAECMALGKPVIATAWSGNLDFMDAQNSCLVGYRFVAVGEGEYPDSAGQRWAEADVDEAAAWMRRLADEQDLAQRIGARAQADVARRLAPAGAGEALTRVLAARARML